MSPPTSEASIFDDPEALRAMAAPPSDRRREYGAVFPLGLYETFLQALRERAVRTLTYRDLFDGCDDRDHERGYPGELDHWRRQRRDPARIDLLIQHDVDFVPRFTQRLVALEAIYGVRSSIFLFNQFPREIPPDSPYAVGIPYEIDHAFFRDAERRGFVIGYHQNALTLTGALDAAVEQFRADVSALRQHYDIAFFCPHGGRAVETGGQRCHNVDVPVPPELAGGLRWVYNRYGLRFSARWSDGGLRGITGDDRLDGLDIVERFVGAMEPGRRYFALVHPQLWGHHLDEAYNPGLTRRPWHQRAWAAAAASVPGAAR